MPNAQSHVSTLAFDLVLGRNAKCVSQRILARAAASEETEESIHAVHVPDAVYDSRCDRCRRFGLVEPSWVVHAWGEAVVVGAGDKIRIMI